MKVYKEISLSDFEAWSGGADTMRVLRKLDEIMEDIDVFKSLESTLEEWNENGMNETEMNDILWFENDTIAEWLGFESWEELERKVNFED